MRAMLPSDSSSGSRVVVETIESQALRGNPLGDLHVRRLPVYLPPGYAQGDQRYPAVYLLAGFTGTGAHRYEEFDDGHRNIPYRYDVSLEALSKAMPDA